MSFRIIHKVPCVSTNVVSLGRYYKYLAKTMIITAEGTVPKTPIRASKLLANGLYLQQIQMDHRNVTFVFQRDRWLAFAENIVSI